VFNATFNDISVIYWRSVLLVEETEYPEKTTDLSQVTDKLYHVPGENHRPVARGPGENHRPVASH